MASSTQDSSAPDSWDSIEDPGPGEDLSTQLKGLNVNASPFVPNVNAPVFVPSFMKTPQQQGKLNNLLFSYIASGIELSAPIFQT